ncbi:MAG TPA: hypothetical protein VG755_14945 [Nannocystaceae bacterium]|nr:hypothetical protein [Nannocystaceae bacterium]
MTFALVAALAIARAPEPAPEELHSEPLVAIEQGTVPLADALEVRAGATCLERDRLVEQIRTWFDHERIDERLVIEVVGDVTEPRKLAFTLRRGEQVISVRRFDPAPDRCADLHAVVGLAIALAIDATLLETVAGDPTKPIRPPDPPPYHHPEIDTRLPPQRKPRSWRLFAEVTAQLSIGAPPDIGGGGRVALRTSWRQLLDIGVSAFAGSAGRSRIGDGRALLSVVGGRVDLCAGPPWTRVRPRGCAGVLAGAAFAAGQGFENDQTARVFWLSIPFGIDLEVQLSPRVNLLLGIEGLPAVWRPTFTQTNTSASRRFARFGANVEAGLAFRLW